MSSEGSVTMTRHTEPGGNSTRAHSELTHFERVPSASWVCTSYLAMGAIYSLVGSTSNVLYLDFGLSVRDASWYPSLFVLPYALKPLWAPLLELRESKRSIVVWTQLTLAATCLLATAAIRTPWFLIASATVFVIMGVLGATMDMASDGVYVTTLNDERAARLAGFQSSGWMLGPIFATGLLVILVGSLQSAGFETGDAWQVALGAVALTLSVLSAWHHWSIPTAIKRGPSTATRPALATFRDAVVSFARKPSIVPMIAFAVLFRTSQGFLDKIGPAFLKTPIASGGLGVDNERLGWLNGTLGTIGIAIGTLLGGYVVSRAGLRRCLPWLCVAFNLPNGAYLLLSWLRPETTIWIGSAIVFEKFFFGVGSVGHIVYLIQQVSPGPFRTAHLAFGTALMGLCMSVTGMLGAILVEPLGYSGYFAFVMVATIPSFLVTWFAPFERTVDADPHRKT